MEGKTGQQLVAADLPKSLTRRIDDGGQNGTTQANKHTHNPGRGVDELQLVDVRFHVDAPAHRGLLPDDLADKALARAPLRLEVALLVLEQDVLATARRLVDLDELEVVAQRAGLRLLERAVLTPVEQRHLPRHQQSARCVSGRPVAFLPPVATRAPTVPLLYPYCTPTGAPAACSSPHRTCHASQSAPAAGTSASQRILEVESLEGGVFWRVESVESLGGLPAVLLFWSVESRSVRPVAKPMASQARGAGPPINRRRVAVGITPIRD
eukprot:scaffold42688_cov61-Phaeocystis_antarctica.AAC.3